MARPASRHPTELELEILKILWRNGPKGATGREVQDALAASGRKLAYTSVVTILTIMARKGYARRKKGAAGSFAYYPRITEKATAGQMLRDLVDRVFHGSPGAVMLNLLEDGALSADDIARLRDIVDSKANDSKPPEDRP
jgi:BlaI family transcriptional regulator, penicillinase repressor